MIRRLLRSLRQRWCRHECSVGMLRRTGAVSSAPCLKCGKVLDGPYGLALPCRWRIS